MNAAFEEVVDFVEEGSRTSEQILNSADDTMRTAGNIIRPCSIAGCILGFYLLFAPIIALLEWIPLVGLLLGFAMKVAAFLFALTVGGTVACLVLGLAWLFFRPWIGIGLLILTASGLCMIFLINPDDGSGQTFASMET
jgi:hypothetical protein